MNKSYLIFKHEFLQKIKSASFIILTLSVPVLALLGIAVFKLATNLTEPPMEEISTIEQQVNEVGMDDYQTDEERNIANIIIPGVFSLLLALALMFGATSLLSGLGEEKESRLIEVLFSSVSVRQLLVSKVLALGITGLLQVLVWLISTPLLLSMASSTFGGFISKIQIPANFLVLGTVYFILGYLLFAVLSIGIGAISSSYTEGGTLSLFYTLTSFVPLWFLALLINFPDSPLWIVLTIFPITAPIQVMLRLGMSAIPLWQILTSIGVMGLSISVGLILSIKIFRMYMLMYGKRPSIAEIIKGLKNA